MIDQRIEIAASAMWRNRSLDPHLNWRRYEWDKFAEQRPELAAIYRENAAVAIAALDEAYPQANAETLATTH